MTLMNAAALSQPNCARRFVPGRTGRIGWLVLAAILALTAVAALTLSSLRTMAAQPRPPAQSSAPATTPFDAELLAPDVAPAPAKTHR